MGEESKSPQEMNCPIVKTHQVPTEAHHPKTSGCRRQKRSYKFPETEKG